MRARKFVFPGLEVSGAGEIAYPVNEAQAKTLIGRHIRLTAHAFLNSPIDEREIREKAIETMFLLRY